jgi:hypothetical protein
VGVVPSGPTMWASGLLGWISGSKENAVKQLLNVNAIKSGMGKGEVAVRDHYLCCAACMLGRGRQAGHTHAHTHARAHTDGQRQAEIERSS